MRWRGIANEGMKVDAHRMNTLLLTGVSDDLRQTLAERAAANRRSIEEEALCCLQITVAQDEANK